MSDEKTLQEFNKAVDSLVDAVVEEEKTYYNNDLEPFEMHASRLRQEIHQEMDEFKNNFLEGYKIVMEELTQRYGIQGQQQDKPSGKGIRI